MRGRAVGVQGAVLAPFALGAGMLLSVAFPPLSGRWAALLAVAVLDAVLLRARGFRPALALGALFGVGVVATSTTWMLLLTVEAFVGLVLVQVPFYAALGAGLFAVRRWRGGPWWAAGVWTTVEHFFSTIPFGGFPWLRIGYAAVDTPLASLLPVVGTGGATFAVALVATALGRLASRAGPGAAPRGRALTALVALAAVLGASVASALVPPAVAVGSVRVGWVQGGTKGYGIYGLGDPRTTTYAHAQAVQDLMHRVDAGELPRPDFVVAPENTTDMDPFLDATTRALVVGMVARAGVPVLVGTPLAGPTPDTRRTTSTWWTPEGPGPSYDKQHLVPMGEWIPFREVFLPLVPALAYVGEQTLPGPEPGSLDVTLPDGRPTVVGVGVCYDVAFGEAFRGQVGAGAQVLVVQSNNTMYAPSPQLRQQFDITRVRAAEVGRPILVVTVSGTSGLIDGRGRPVSVAPEGVPATGVAEMELLQGRTPFVAGGWLAEPVVAWGTLLVLAGVPLAARAGVVGKNGRSRATLAGRTES